MRLSASLSGVSDLAESLRDLPDAAEEAVTDRLQEAAEDGADKARRRLAKNTSRVSTGALPGSIRVETGNRRDGSVVLVVAGGPRATHAKPIEFGAKPHFPPVKRVSGEISDLDEKMLREEGSREEAFQKAFNVAKKIAAEGTKEIPFMRPGFRAAKMSAKKKMQTLSETDLRI